MNYHFLITTNHFVKILKVTLKLNTIHFRSSNIKVENSPQQHSPSPSQQKQRKKKRHSIGASICPKTHFGIYKDKSAFLWEKVSWPVFNPFFYFFALMVVHQSSFQSRPFERRSPKVVYPRLPANLSPRWASLPRQAEELKLVLVLSSNLMPAQIFSIQIESFSLVLS